jgi:hypothetical protein
MNSYSFIHSTFLAVLNANGNSFPEQFRKLREACDHKQITLLDSYMSRKELFGLIENCDCYVSLHRAEGFGLPIAEAMLLRKPTIATAWSGNLDFTTPDNSLLVQHGFSTNPEDYGPYKRGMRWAEPDIEHAAKLMQVLFQDQALAKTLGERGTDTIAEKYGADRVAEALYDRLERIKGRVHRVELLAKYKAGLLGSKDQLEAAISDDSSNQALQTQANGKGPIRAAETKQVSASKTGASVEQLERFFVAWWHRPIVGVPLRVFSACLKRLIIYALKGEPMQNIRRQVLDQTFEGIAHLVKMDAERIDELERRVRSLEAEAQFADRFRK